MNTDSPISITVRVAGRCVAAGWTLGLGGGLLAFAAVAALGQGATSYEVAAGFVHKVSLIVTLLGMLLALIGYRIRWFEGRSGPQARTLPSLIGDHSTGPFDHLPSAARRIEPDRRHRIEVIDAELMEPSAAAARGANPAADLSSNSFPTAQLASIFSLTIAIAAGLVCLVALGRTGLFVAGAGNVLLTLVLLLVVLLGKGYQRAFAVAAMIPSVLLLALVPFILLAAGRYGSIDEVVSMSGIMLVGWLAVIPVGLLGVLVWSVINSKARPQR